MEYMYTSHYTLVCLEYPPALALVMYFSSFLSLFCLDYHCIYKVLGAHVPINNTQLQLVSSFNSVAIFELVMPCGTSDALNLVCVNSNLNRLHYFVTRLGRKHCG